MKKSYIYFVLPIAALVIFFFAFYWNAHKNYADREAAKVKAVRDAKEAKLLKESKDREKAVQAALELQEKRKKERAEREVIEAAAKDKREKERQARDKAGRDADKLEAQVRRIQKEIDTQKRKLEETKGEKSRILDEEIM